MRERKGQRCRKSSRHTTGRSVQWHSHTLLTDNSPPIASHRCAHDVMRSAERAGRLWADLPGVQTPTPHTEATVASSLTKTAEHTRWNSSREFLTDRSQTRNQRPRTPKRHVNNRHKHCTSLHAQGRLPLSSIHSDRKLKDFMCVVYACLL